MCDFGKVFARFGFVDILEVDVVYRLRFHVRQGARKRQDTAVVVEITDCMTDDPEVGGGPGQGFAVLGFKDFTETAGYRGWIKTFEDRSGRLIEVLLPPFCVVPPSSTLHQSFEFFFL